MATLIYDEMELFLVCMLLGAVLALGYDMVRILRMLISHKDWVVDLEDLAFWLVTAWLVFRTLFVYNRGTLRGYAFLGLFLGFLCYELTVSKVLLWLAGKMLPLWNRGKRLFIRPFIGIGHFVRKGLKNIRAQVKMAIKSR
jgi:spore cortex biosynthesis protein YabQ